MQDEAGRLRRTVKGLSKSFPGRGNSRCKETGRKQMVLSGWKRRRKIEKGRYKARP